MSEDGIDPVALGQAITRLRERRGWSLHRLAQNAGVADPYLRRVERGDGAGVGIAVLARIAQALQVRLEDLVREAEGPGGGGGSDIMSIYRSLDLPHRQFLDRMGHELRELQAAYNVQMRQQQEEDEDIPNEPKAAHPRDLRELPTEEPHAE